MTTLRWVPLVGMETELPSEPLETPLSLICLPGPTYMIVSQAFTLVNTHAQAFLNHARGSVTQ